MIEKKSCDTCKHGISKYIQWLDENVVFCSIETLRRKCFKGIPSKRVWTFDAWESKQGVLF